MNTPTRIQIGAEPRFRSNVDADRSWQVATTATVGWLGVGALGLRDAIGGESKGGSRSSRLEW